MEKVTEVSASRDYWDKGLFCLPFPSLEAPTTTRIASSSYSRHFNFAVASRGHHTSTDRVVVQDFQQEGDNL